MGNICGCGRTILEIETAITGLKSVEDAMQHEMPDFMKEDMDGIKKTFQGLFGMWLTSLSTECDIDKETAGKIYDLAKNKEYTDAEDILRKTLISCAGMKW